MAETVLTGRKAIQTYCGRSWPTIQEWIRTRGFPAAKITGIWESDKELVNRWRRNQIAMCPSLEEQGHG